MALNLIGAVAGCLLVLMFRRDVTGDMRALLCVCALALVIALGLIRGW